MRLDELRECVERCSLVPDISISTRSRSMTIPRHVFYNIGYRLGYGKVEMAHFLGFEHGGVYNALNKFEESMEKYPSYKQLYQTVMDKVENKNQQVEVFGSKIPQSFLKKVSLLSDEQMQDFEKSRLDPYIKTKVLS